MGVTVRAVEPADYSAWAELFRGYRAFYKLPSDETGSLAQRVWTWVLDPGHEVSAFVAIDGEGNVVGLAHYRRFARPCSTGIWLDDLFTLPSSRGQGVARALIGRVSDLAAEEGCSVVRWITAESNTTARALYDKVAVQTDWVTYDCKP